MRHEQAPKATPTRQADWPIGWVLEDAARNIVGTMGNIPLLYELDAKRIVAASGRHWVAETAHRSASILLLDSLIAQRRIDLTPYRRTLSAWQYFYRANNPALRATLIDKRVWAPSLFDGDATL